MAILLTAGTVTAAAAATLVVSQLRHYEMGRLAWRAQGMDAFQHRDYRTAAADFSRYLSNDRVDPDAIYALAICRTKLPRPDLGHLLDAKKLFVRYLELKPGDLDAEHQLLDIYQRLRYPAETMTIADHLLEKNPDDVAALLAKLQQLDRDLKYAQAMPISLRLNELTPLDIRTQITTLELMAHLRRPTADIISHADRLLEVHPDDPRFQLLRAVASFFAHDVNGTKQWLHTASTGTPPDADFILLLVNVFDKLGMWDDSRAVLQKAAAAPSPANQIKATLAQRLFELGQYDASLVVLKGVNPADPGSDSHLLGLYGLMLCQGDRSSQGHSNPVLNAVISTLHKRDDDLIATAWYSLLQVVTADPQSDPLQPIRWCQTAGRLDPDNSDARFYLGLEYLQLGESELALQFFRQTTQMQPEWATPYIMIARILLQRGQAAEASVSAQTACDRDPHSVTALAVAALAAYQALRPAATAGDIAPLLTYIKQVRDLDPNDPQLLCAEVDLLARSNQRADATTLALASLSASPAILRGLESVDQTDHLDIAGAIADKAAQIQPITPQAALDQIEIFSAANKADLGRRQLPAMESHRTVEWRIAWLKAREALGDSDVGLAWEIFADSLPHNFDAQRAAIQSPSVNADRALMDRTIDRYKALTGEDSIEWKLARARWQLAGVDDVKNSATAVAAAMAEVARTTPQYIDPQILWADALVKLGDNGGAIAHLRQAASIDPASPLVSLKLATVLMDQGQTQDALGLLNGMVNSSALTSSQRVDTARLYRQAGMPTPGIALLTADQQTHPNDPSRDLLLAQMLAERGDQPAAARIYTALIQQPTTTSAVVRAAAWFCASQGQIDQARQCLARLNQVPMPAGEKEILLGQFECAFGTTAAALADFQAAAKASAHSPHPWLAWSGLDLRTRDFSGAVKVASEGLKNAPDDAALKAMIVRGRTLAGVQLNEQMQPLIDSLAADPTSEGGIATLAAIADSQTAHESADALSDRFAAVIEQYPRYLPALTILVPRDCAAGRYDRAAKLSTRACELLPIEPEPARLLTIVLSTSSQWDLALSAATQWRNRTLDHPRNADLAIAAAQIALNRGDRAIAQLFPYLNSAITDSATAGDNVTPATTTIELYLNALCLDDRADQARLIAEPLAKQSPAWRRRWLRIISLTAKSPAAGAEQLQQIDPLLAPTSIDDQLARGDAWCTLGTRFANTDALQKALSIADALTDAAPVPADVWLLQGGIYQQLNQLPESETAFTKAVQAAPDSAIAKNNLAMVMWLRKEDPRPAQQLATAAVTAAPNNSSMHTTLGEIDEELNDFDSAKTQFEIALRLNTDNAEALIGLASTQERCGHSQNNAQLLQHAQAIIQTSHPALPQPVQQQLQRLLGGKQ